MSGEENKSTRWSENEIALFAFARKRDLTHKQIAQVLDRTPAGVTMMGASIGQFERGTLPKNTFRYKLIAKGLQLEFRVDSDATYLDHKRRWFDKIERVTGIHYGVDAQIEALERIKKEREEELRAEEDKKTVEERKEEIRQDLGKEAQEFFSPKPNTPTIVVEDLEEEKLDTANTYAGNEDVDDQEDESEEVVERTVPFFSIHIDVESVIRIINAFKK